MSSDCFYITIQKIEDKQIYLRVRTGTAGGLNDRAATRSFALCVLLDARRRGREDNKKIPTTLTALEQEATSFQSNWYSSESFMKEHLSKYIETTEQLKRKNKISESKESKIYDFVERVEAQDGLTLEEREEKYCTKMHYIELLVTMTDAKWLGGIQEGWMFGTTAYDVWWNDPLNPIR